jgi:methenyltetrahydromethanopterin cyclohydrolase
VSAGGLVASAASLRYNHAMPTLNDRAWQLSDAMAADADSLGIGVHTLAAGTRIIDCGVEAPGSLEAGRRLAEVCLSGQGSVELARAEEAGSAAAHVRVASDDPVAACMASQYAGWELKSQNFFAMGSGPMRAAAGHEELFDSIGHREQSAQCVGILETSSLPPDVVCIDIAQQCRIAPNRLTLLTARTASPAGTVQIVARSVETALHKLHVLGFDLARVASGSGLAPLPPVAGDDLTAIGWTNDAILYGASVTLTIRGGLHDIEEIGPRVPSNSSSDYGRPFREIFAGHDHDFYRIDPLLFSPARITFRDADGTTPSQTFGELAHELLATSFASANHKK